MVKPDGWEKRLLGFIKSKQGSKFEWGKNDCVSLAFGAIEAISNSPLAEHEGKHYKSKKEAFSFSKKFNPVDFLNNEMLFCFVTPQFQQFGDVGFAYQKGLWRGTVFLGRYAASIAPGHSLTFFPSEKTAAVDSLKIMRLL